MDWKQNTWCNVELHYSSDEIPLFRYPHSVYVFNWSWSAWCFWLVRKRAWGGRVETKWETLSAWNIHSYDRYTVFVYLVTPKTYLLFVTLRELSLRLVYLTLIIALVDNFTRHCTQFNQDILYNDEKQWRLFVKSSQQMWAIENSKYISLTYPLFSMRHAPMSCNELHRYWTVVLLCYVRSWMISWWSGMVQ